VRETNADAVLAGAGVANLAAWLGVQQARAYGSDVQLTAEIGLWGYEATLADPFVLNHRNFPTATMLGDAQMVLGALVGGAGTTTIGCLGGAQIDRFGNVNSTHILPRPFLVGSGGGNDVASTATENVVVATLTPQRTVAECSYITSPGERVRALVTDLGAFEKRDGELVLTALAPGTTVDEVRELCGWELRVAEGQLLVLDAPTVDEVAALRRWDPRGWFLRA
jgi:acyl CoA:acetate/3-ketoacid CoA transferase beta subunit